MSREPAVYIAGLDLGRPHEFTALAILERTEVPIPDDPRRRIRHYAVRHLERLPPATPYAEVFARLTDMFAAEPLRASRLVVDYTGVGQPVLDMLRKAKVGAKIIPLFVTAGHRHTSDERGGWCVPRQELAATLQVLLQSRRLQVAPVLPEAATLARELAAFQLKVAATKKDELDAWRQGTHDDLVLAVAVAAWLGENALRRFTIWV
ncbi:MAG TPA: hypothetical protein VH575_07735 [Gemmataceae bacterium]|jgi:hypothetical protein